MSSKVRTAVFPVGGLGTRFLPATKAMPKEMLTVVDKPLIQYAVEEAREAGCERFIFVTSRGKSLMEDHFDHSPELKAALLDRGKQELWELIRPLSMPEGSVMVTRQPEALGLGHAVWCARHLVDGPFAVLLPDDLIQPEAGGKGCLAQMVEAHASTGGNVVAVMEVPREHTKRYGVLGPGAAHGRLTEVKALVEKPSPETAPSTLAVVGRYIIDPLVFEHLDRRQRGAGNEIQLTDSLAAMIGARPFHGYSFEGTRFDCGDKIGYIQAQIAYALARPDLAGPVRAFIQSSVR